MIKRLTLLWAMVSLVAAVFGLKWATPYNPDSYADDLPSSVVVGELRVQLLSDSLVRIEAQGERGFENRPSFTVEKRTGWDEVAYTQKVENGFTVIETACYTVYVPENSVSSDGCYITDGDGNELWRFETHTDSNVYLPSPSDELKAWYFTDTPRVIPSEDGYGVSRKWYNYNGWDLTNDAQDLFVFLPGGDYKTFTGDFVELTGRSEMLTLNLLGFWDSRYYEYTQASAYQQINDYADRGYPLDVMVIDTDWRISIGGTGYSINRALFPDMKGFLEDAHEKGLSIVFNDHPEPVAGTDNLLDRRELVFRNYNLKKLLKTGLDYWWYDRNWWTSLKPIEDGLSIYTTGMYAYHQITEDYYESIAKRGEYSARPLIMANVDGIDNGTQSYASELAAHRYSLQWTGDIGTSSADLRDEIHNAVYGGSEMGLPYISADLGGHTAEVTRDMYVRWIQFGALSPICRVHCTKPYSRMPWLYGETAERVTRSYVELRYRLLPLFYALAHENYESGLPLLRRLDISYPQYAEADANDEYLLGDSILVAPISESYPESEGYTFTSGGKPGLKGEYFENDTFDGEPAVVKQDERVYFDWVFSAPDGLEVSDYFSVRWTGELHVGDEPVFLRAFSDDGIRIFIDGELVIDGWDKYDTVFSTDFLEANSTHSIKIEYCDGNNHAHIFVTAHSLSAVTRDVFIPDGQWMDVWTGQSYSGPANITVSHGLETSPIFVRMGSVLTLADNMLNTNDKDWSHLTLEVFPSLGADARTTLYEDDTKTVAYKDGKRRTTDITLRGDSTQVLTVEPAKGEFNSPRAFASRSYTVRVHRVDGWGELTGVTLNGEEIAFEALERDAAAQPLAIVGGARDSQVYTLTFEAPVNAQSVLAFTFDGAEAEQSDTDYDDSEAELSVSVNKLDKQTADFTIPADSSDWVLYGLNWDFDTARKAQSDNSIGELYNRGSKDLFDDNYRISWLDGGGVTEGSSACGLVSYHDFTTTLKADGDSVFKLYLGGHKSLAKLTVRDRSGNNVRTVTFGDLNENYYREVVIEADGESELEVTYSLLCGFNITAAACVAQ